jgi:hypothetical protein
MNRNSHAHQDVEEQHLANRKQEMKTQSVQRKS